MDMKELARVGAQHRLAQLKEEIDAIRSAFPGIDGGSVSSGSRKRRTLSAATRAKMRAAWAKRKAASGQSAATAASPRKKGGISAAGRAAIAAAQKKRWAAIKAGKKK